MKSAFRSWCWCLAFWCCRRRELQQQPRWEDERGGRHGGREGWFDRGGRRGGGRGRWRRGRGGSGGAAGAGGRAGQGGAGGAAGQGGTDGGTGPVTFDAGSDCVAPAGEAPLDVAAAGLPAGGLVLWLRGDCGVYKTAGNAVCAWVDRADTGGRSRPTPRARPGRRPDWPGCRPFAPRRRGRASRPAACSASEPRRRAPSLRSHSSCQRRAASRRYSRGNRGRPEPTSASTPTRSTPPEAEKAST